MRNLTLVMPWVLSACEVCSARSTSPARPATARGLPLPGLSRVSPPATRITSVTWPALAPRTALVENVSAGSSVVTIAVAVSSLAVEAGVRGTWAETSSR